MICKNGGVKTGFGARSAPRFFFNKGSKRDVLVGAKRRNFLVVKRGGLNVIWRAKRAEIFLKRGGKNGIFMF